jgi:hypothetical protein
MVLHLNVTFVFAAGQEKAKVINTTHPQRLHVIMVSRFRNLGSTITTLKKKVYIINGDVTTEIIANKANENFLYQIRQKPLFSLCWPLKGPICFDFSLVSVGLEKDRF